MPALLKPAPAWTTTQWFNTPEDLSLEALKGRAVVLYGFQMLCPGCVAHALPQAQRVHDTFAGDKLAVIGLHSVFEHHSANSPETLAAFIHENRLSFPVGIDAPTPGRDIPRTMEAYAMRGTPTVVLIDAEGRLRQQIFGHVPDLQLGAAIAGLIAGEAPNAERAAGAVCTV